uniref:small subunit processome component 20 homolog isoform X2 n=1 Tax=Oncorhynchus gorbuscha TaxID=8017 RepID=UPI001EAEDF01|nr:small subunit processome component 20 homolog isoform X2 [Oncorhynchus gorbuscha]
MRVLFGPMRSKTGSKFQGQSGAVQRSSIVLRFLAGCQSEELGMFIDLCWSPSATTDRAGCIAPLKNLRRLGVLRIQDFFDGFDSYSFTPDELDAVFQAIVWPQVCRLPTESPYSPTPLLKLIHVWSKNARYFPLLAKQQTGHPECDVLLNVFALLSAKNVSTQTVAMVMDITESLVTTKDLLVSEGEEAELSFNGSVFSQPPEGAYISSVPQRHCTQLCQTQEEEVSIPGGQGAPTSSQSSAGS